MRCDKCSAQARITLRYGPHNFCGQHFTQFFERRFKRTVRNYKLLGKRESIAVGVSGGKDSTVLLHLMQNMFSPPHKITAVLIDEGVPKYRDRALAVARKNCKGLGVEFREFSFRDAYGATLTEIMRRIAGRKKELGSSCAFCGVLRRNLLNKAALELHAGKLATGHNLDDEVQSILMNLFDNDLRRLARLGALAGVEKFSGFVPRIKPLYETPESEIIAYAAFKGIEYYGEKCCPFAWQAKRNEFRSMVEAFEDKFPGTKYSILRAFLRMKPHIAHFAAESGKMQNCILCGAPSSHEMCMSCTQLGKVGIRSLEQLSAQW